jgi:hypothetical protein
MYTHVAKSAWFIQIQSLKVALLPQPVLSPRVKAIWAQLSIGVLSLMNVIRILSYCCHFYDI